MGSKVCNLIKKTDARYVEGSTQYERNGQLVAGDNSSFLSASNGIYYQVDKTKQSERTAEQNLERMAVSLQNMENRFGKHAFNIFDQGNKLVELVNGNQPCDPAWAEKFLQDLAEMATAFKRVAERNQAKFESWSAEPVIGTPDKSDTKTRVWSPM
jgi:hypothetical protein